MSRVSALHYLAGSQVSEDFGQQLQLMCWPTYYCRSKYFLVSVHKFELNWNRA